MTEVHTPPGDTEGTGGHPSGDERFAVLDKSVRRVRASQDQLIELLHVAQEIFGYLSDDVLVYLARQLRLPQSRVYGVATFYQLFTFERPGAHTCTVCTGTACFVKGADDVVRALTESFGVPPGSTTEDGVLTLSSARCLGACGLAPVVVLDGAVRGHETADSTVAAVRALIADAEASA